MENKRYDLCKMLNEIKEDEKKGTTLKKEASQKEIMEMLAKRQKKTQNEVE